MKTIFQKEYDGESIHDVQRDVMEAFNAKFNPVVSEIPQDENGFQEGQFMVTVKWSPYAEEE
ncbi:hypothetical protein ENKO_162 [Klebsiella phage fENko-Kae01]|nr:hypothetical protein [Klebsiella phage fENko-Kae01]